MKIKVGDKVVYIDDSRGYLINEYETYTVKKINEDFVELIETGDYNHRIDRFALEQKDLPKYSVSRTTTYEHGNM